jgi:hypothetical protein
LQNRKFCFDCSPFGSHNTLDLTKNKDSRKYNKRSELNCKQCNNKLSCRQKKGLICWNCHNAKTRLDRKIEVIKLLGSKCCICGYDKCRQALEIHHVNPKDKKMGLSLREMSFKWEDILNELKKCVLLCCLCHREYHSGLISQAEIENNWNEATAPYPNPSY